VERLVEGLHADIDRLAHQVLQLMNLALADQVGGQWRIKQYFNCRTPALAVRSWYQLLGDDRLEVERQIHPDLVVLLRREEVDDPVQRLVGVVGVQGTETEV